MSDGVDDRTVSFSATSSRGVGYGGVAYTSPADPQHFGLPYTVFDGPRGDHPFIVDRPPTLESAAHIARYFFYESHEFVRQHGKQWSNHTEGREIATVVLEFHVVEQIVPIVLTVTLYRYRASQRMHGVTIQATTPSSQRDRYHMQLPFSITYTDQDPLQRRIGNTLFAVVWYNDQRIDDIEVVGEYGSINTDRKLQNGIYMLHTAAGSVQRVEVYNAGDTRARVISSSRALSPDERVIVADAPTKTK